MNGNVLGKLCQSLSSREVAKTKLGEEARKLEKGLKDLCTLLFWSLEHTKFLGMLELQYLGQFQTALVTGKKLCP